MRDFTESLNKEFDCGCTRTHYVPIRAICTDLKGTIPVAEWETLLGGKCALLLCDKNTETLNSAIAAALTGAGWSLTVREFQTESALVNDESVLGAAVFDAGPKVDGIIAVGGGTITDLGRFVGSRLHKPFVLYMTCPSMDGYASNVAGMMVGGKKKVFKDCVFPDGIYGDVQVMKNAPYGLIKSGFGDILGKRTALPDWILSNRMTGEYLCERVVSLVDESSMETLQNLDGIVAGQAGAIGVLTDALVLAGITMALAADTRPASGSEHIFSHFLVNAAIDAARPVPSHGETVGFGTLVSTLLYRYLLDEVRPEELLCVAERLECYLLPIEQVRAALETSRIGAAVETHLSGKAELAEMIRSSAGPEKRYTVLRYLNDHGLLQAGIEYVLVHI